MTTTPTMRWCSSRTTLVTRGTRSKASCSEPLSSATTTSRLVHVKTALGREEKCWATMFLHIHQHTSGLETRTFLRCCDELATPTSLYQWGGSAAPSAPTFHQESPPQTRHRGDLWQWRVKVQWNDTSPAGCSHVLCATVEGEGVLTSACIKELCPLDEAQVACPGPQSQGIPEAQFGIEMISLQTLLPVDGVVATGIVRTAHPDLKTNDTQVNFFFWTWTT